MLSRDAIELLLELLEQPRPLLAAAARRMTQPAADALLKAGLLRRAGYEKVVPEDGGEIGPSEVEVDDQGEAWATFDEVHGIRRIPADEMILHDVDVRQLLHQLTSMMHRPARSALQEPGDGVIWDLGTFRLPGRANPVEMWFACRAFDPLIWRTVEAAARARPLLGQRIILTSTAQSRLAWSVPMRHRLLSLHGLLRPDAALALPPGLLTAILDGPAGPDDGDFPVPIGDGREIRFRGRTYIMPRGDKQRRIVTHLVEAVRRGERAVSVASIVADLDLGEGIRMRDLFKGSPAWGRLLRQRGGMLEFCWDD